MDIVANYVSVNIDPEKDIFEYEVSFSPPQDSRHRHKLLNQHTQIFGPVKIVNGVTLYLPYQLSDEVCLVS